MGYCQECLATYDDDLELFQDLWACAGQVIMGQDAAQRCLDLLYRVTHARILKRCGPQVARYYPTPKRYEGALGEGALWWTFHATGGVSIYPVLVWFSGQPRRAPRGRGVLRPRGGSTHFAIDHDGTPYFFVGLRDGSWHCRSRNFDSLSVELVNACALKLAAPKGTPEYRWWAGRYDLPYTPVPTSPWRGGLYWQPYDERQLVSLVKLMRVVSEAAGRSRFHESRCSQHSDWNPRKLDCGPLFPAQEVVRVGLGDGPVSEADFARAFHLESHQMYDHDTEVGPHELSLLFDHAVELDAHHGDDLEEEPLDTSPALSLASVQEAYDLLGIDTGLADGVFGPRTQRATKEFQVMWNKENPSNMLSVDGIPGPLTRRALNEHIKRQAFR